MFLHVGKMKSPRGYMNIWLETRVSSFSLFLEISWKVANLPITAKDF